MDCMVPRRPLGKVISPQTLAENVFLQIPGFRGPSYGSWALQANRQAVRVAKGQAVTNEPPLVPIQFLMDCYDAWTFAKEFEDFHITSYAKRLDWAGWV